MNIDIIKWIDHSSISTISNPPTPASFVSTIPNKQSTRKLRHHPQVSLFPPPKLQFISLGSNPGLGFRGNWLVQTLIISYRFFSDFASSSSPGPHPAVVLRRTKFKDHHVLPTLILACRAVEINPLEHLQNTVHNWGFREKSSDHEPSRQLPSPLSILLNIDPGSPEVYGDVSDWCLWWFDKVNWGMSPPVWNIVKQRNIIQGGCIGVTHPQDQERDLLVPPYSHGDRKSLIPISTERRNYVRTHVHMYICTSLGRDII